MPVIDTIQFRRGTAAAWTSANTVLLDGEPGLETDTKKWKVGDGTTAWNSLPYDRDLAAHLADTTDAHDASAISILDSGAYFTATDVEAALQYLANLIGGASTESTSVLDYVTRDLTSAGGYIDVNTLWATAPVFIQGNPVTYDGSTQICIEFFLAAVESFEQQSIVPDLYMDGTFLFTMADMSTPSVSAGTIGRIATSLYGRTFLTPSAGSHTFDIRVWTATDGGAPAGSNTVYSGSQGVTRPSYGTVDWAVSFMRITAAQGMTSLSKSGSSLMTGDVTLTAGSGISITQTPGDLLIVADGSGTGSGGEILITDTPAGTPLVFADLMQNEAEDDIIYSG